MTRADAVKAAKRLRLGKRAAELLVCLHERLEVQKHQKVNIRMSATVRALRKRRLVSASGWSMYAYHIELTDTGRELAAGLAGEGESPKDGEDRGLGYMQGKGAA